MTLADCHPQRKMQARGLCKPCYDKWLKKENAEYKANQKQNTKNWFAKNPEKAKLIQERRRHKDRTDPERRLRYKNRWLKREYGITIEQYLNLIEIQNNSCALCYRKPGKIALHVDHCHKTNKVRGLLCHQCNWYLGTIDADPTIINRIIEYLKRGE